MTSAGSHGLINLCHPRGARSTVCRPSPVLQGTHPCPEEPLPGSFVWLLRGAERLLSGDTAATAVGDTGLMRGVGPPRSGPCLPSATAQPQARGRWLSSYSRVHKQSQAWGLDGDVPPAPHTNMRVSDGRVGTPSPSQLRTPSAVQPHRAAGNTGYGPGRGARPPCSWQGEGFVGRGPAARGPAPKGRPAVTAACSAAPSGPRADPGHTPGREGLGVAR